MVDPAHNTCRRGMCRSTIGLRSNQRGSFGEYQVALVGFTRRSKRDTPGETPKIPQPRNRDALHKQAVLFVWSARKCTLRSTVVRPSRMTVNSTGQHRFLFVVPRSKIVRLRKTRFTKSLIKLTRERTTQPRRSVPVYCIGLRNSKTRWHALV